MRGRKRAPRNGLEVHHLQRVSRALQNGRIARCGKLLRPGASGWHESGARGKELNEVAAVRVHAAAL
jgi:hypothetical protein